MGREGVSGCPKPRPNLPSQPTYRPSTWEPDGGRSAGPNRVARRTARPNDWRNRDFERQIARSFRILRVAGRPVRPMLIRGRPRPSSRGGADSQGAQGATERRGAHDTNRPEVSRSRFLPSGRDVVSGGGAEKIGAPPQLPPCRWNPPEGGAGGNARGPVRQRRGMGGPRYGAPCQGTADRFRNSARVSRGVGGDAWGASGITLPAAGRPCSYNPESTPPEIEIRPRCPES